MMKGKVSNFNKTISKHKINQNEQNSGKATRRGYFKLSKKQADLVSIIKDMQKNMHQLKRYHQSLQKPLIRIKKSLSINQLSKPLSRVLSKAQSKQSCLSRGIRAQKPLLKSYQQNTNQIRSSYGKEIHSNYQKYDNQSMISFYHGDVQEVKKAYAIVYGRENTNIVDLYAFFRKTAEKSTRILGSMEMSSFPNHQSQSNHKLNNNKLNSNNYNYFNQYNDINQQNDNNKHNDIKQQNDIKKPKSQLLNVIIQDKKQKQNNFSASNYAQNFNQKITRPSNLKNLTIQQIFKNGSHDLANVYDFVKKRRFSIKNYLVPQRIKSQKQHAQVFKPFQTIKQIKLEQLKLKQLKLKQQQQKQKQQKQNYVNVLNGSPQVKINNEQNMIYFGSKSSKKSKKSKKSSLKSSKHKKAINLNQNIIQQKVKQFKIINQQLPESRIINQQQQKNVILNQQLKQSFVQNQCIHKQQDQIICQLKYINQKFKKSKYYVQPLILRKNNNSLDGSSISLKSSSRIIQLDFIPLDF